MVIEERIEKDENISEELDPVRSGQVFSKPKKEEKNIKLESNNSETIISNTNSSNVSIEIDNIEITKSIVANKSNSNQKKQNNYETPKLIQTLMMMTMMKTKHLQEMRSQNITQIKISKKSKKRLRKLKKKL